MKKRSSLVIFYSVVLALFLREVQVRFGTKRMGYFWAIFDAMAMVFTFASLKYFIAENSMPEVDFSVFLASGFLAFFLWKNIVKKSISAFESNRALFNYKQVKPIDAVFARFALECLVSTMATSLFLIIGLYFDFAVDVQNFNMVILAVVWLSFFGLSVGIFNAVVSSFYPFYSKLVDIVMLPLLFVSAIMYTVDSLPLEVREIILYNPLVHFMEMIHGNYFIVLNTSYVDYEYMMYWTIVPMFLGLFFYKRSEEKIIAS